MAHPLLIDDDPGCSLGRCTTCSSLPHTESRSLELMRRAWSTSRPPAGRHSPRSTTTRQVVQKLGRLTGEALSLLAASSTGPPRSWAPAGEPSAKDYHESGLTTAHPRRPKPGRRGLTFRESPSAGRPRLHRPMATFWPGVGPFQATPSPLDHFMAAIPGGTGIQCRRSPRSSQPSRHRCRAA